MFKQHRASAKVGPASPSSLDQAVDRAEDTFHAFRAKLKALISTLRAHNEAMVKFNSSQVEATNAICDLMITTPLAHCAIGAQTKEEEPSKPDDGAEGKDTEDAHDVSILESTTGSKQERFVSAGIAHSFDTVIGRGKDLNDVEESFKSMFNVASDVNAVYAARYKEWIIRYLEEWESIVTTRVEGKLLQLRKVRDTYVHYSDKVHGLHGQLDKRKAKGSPPKPRLEDKLERNRLKLSGAEEAHHDLARSLISLIEDVTEHYWKDMIPLLHMTIQFSINHSSDLAAVMARLEKTEANLKNVCEQHELEVTGRLEDLKPEPIPEATPEEAEPKKEDAEDEEQATPKDDNEAIEV
ncbi:hypothetical protein ACHAXT_005509 [Thalassiosira profunda]